MVKTKPWFPVNFPNKTNPMIIVINSDCHILAHSTGSRIDLEPTDNTVNGKRFEHPVAVESKLSGGKPETSVFKYKWGYPKMDGL